MSTFDAQVELSAAPAPRTLPELHSFLHGYSIRHPGEQGHPFVSRAYIVMGAVKRGNWSAPARLAAQELAELDPSLSWLPAWKPRVTVAACSRGER